MAQNAATDSQTSTPQQPAASTPRELATMEANASPPTSALETDEATGELVDWAAYHALRLCADSIARAVRARILPSSSTVEGDQDKDKFVDGVELLIVDDPGPVDEEFWRLQIDAQFDHFVRAFAAQRRNNRGALESISTASAEVASVPKQSGTTRSAASLAALLPLLVAGAQGIAGAVPATLAAVAGVASIAGYFSADYTVKGRKVALSDDALKRAVAGRFEKVTVRIFSYGCLHSSPLLSRFADLMEQRYVLAGEAGVLAARAKQLGAASEAAGDAANQLMAAGDAGQAGERPAVTRSGGRAGEEDKAQALQQRIEANAKELAEIFAQLYPANALIEAFDKFVTGITTVKEGAPRSPLVAAAICEAICRSTATHRLYVKVVQSGGQIVTKRRLWPLPTRLYYTGAASVSYLLTDKESRVLAGDVVGQMITLDQDPGRQSFGLLPGPPV